MRVLEKMLLRYFMQTVGLAQEVIWARFCAEYIAHAVQRQQSCAEKGDAKKNRGRWLPPE